MASEEEKKENMVVLRSVDGVHFVVPEREASLSMFIQDNLEYDSANYIVPSDGDETKCKPIRLPVERKTLSMVLRYCHKHADHSRDEDDLWDAEFVAGADHEALYDLILASHYLKIRGLLALVCHAIASKIKGKSPSEICDIFNIKSVFTPESDEETWEHYCTYPLSLEGVPVVPKEKPYFNQLELEEKALRALHIVRCQDFTRCDPKIHGFVCSRFSYYNLALFDHDKETNFRRGPLLHKIPSPMCDSMAQSCVNVISLKVEESDVGFPINVFGTVIARDEVDYRCIYLFRREMDDPQLISSEDDMLALTDPCRGLVLLDEIYFEIDLKIKRDGGEIKDFSRGIRAFEKARLRGSDQTMGLSLISWLSSVELSCAYVHRPVEATIAINVLKGLCNISRVVTSTPGNFRDHIILYEAAEGALQVDEGGSVPLTRRVMVVSLDQKLVLHFVGGDDVFEHLVVTLGHYDQVICRKMGAAELEVRVTWTVVPRRQRCNMFKVVGDQDLLLS